MSGTRNLGEHPLSVKRACRPNIREMQVKGAQKVTRTAKPLVEKWTTERRGSGAE